MQNKKIGIIAAMDEEINAITEIMQIKKINKMYELQYIEGEINNYECIVVKSGVGKTNAARTTQILIDNYNIDFLLNVGTAGSLSEKLEIGDIVIGEIVVNHDFDITAFGHEKGYITNIGKEFYSDKNVIKLLEEATRKISEDLNIKFGIIATGDIFCTEISMKKKIKEKFKADCVEMEAAAIAQVCTLDKIPFAIIRAISDKPNGNNQIEFDKFLNEVTKKYALIIKNL